MPTSHLPEQCELILGNSNKRFSGVTSTMLQTLEYQRNIMPVCVLGAHHLEDPSLAVTFWQLAKSLRKPLPNGKNRVFHARRNNEMIQALLLKHIFAAKIRIVFTSTAQRYHTWLTRWLMSKMDAVISTCQAAASYLKTPPASIIPHGIREDIYLPPADKKQKLHELGYEFDSAIGIFGRVREQKGVHHFVRAAIAALPQQPAALALVVGAITQDNQSFVDGLKAEIAAAGLEQRILFTGERPFSELPGLFQSMSLVAALSRTEGFGLTVLEAMSSGAAVLATDAGAWREVIREDVDGYVVPVEDGDAITARLALMLSDSEKLATMGANGRQRVLDCYTVAREARQLCEFFQSIQ